MLGLAFTLFVSIAVSSALNNGLAKTPAMGWNPYNAFGCSTTEAQYHAQAQALVNLGLSSLGYVYVSLDSGWQGKTRDSSGSFTWDTSILPSGPAALGNFLHGLGLKYGIYSDGGYYACDCVGGTGKYLGSLGYEAADAKTFASWGADYLKYDNCFAVGPSNFVDWNPSIQVQPHFTTMRDALAAVSRPIVYAVCEWGVQDPARWPGTNVGNSWRISNDIGPPASWDNIVRIINQVVPITGFAGPGGWNDLDMLYVGNSALTDAEQQTHFAFWAAVKSPLFIGTDLTKISTSALNILKNTRIIALNQDSLGKPISFKRRYANDYDVWSGPLADGSTVAFIINWQNSSRSLTFSLSDIGLTLASSATNLISGASVGSISNTYTTTVAARGSLVLKLSGTTAAPSRSFTYYSATSSSNTLSGGAKVQSVNSSVSTVGYVGNGGILTFNNIDGGSSGGTKTISLDYINGDFTFTNNACSNCRNAVVSVNGGTGVQTQFPISAQSWDIVASGFLLTLSGFKAGKTNTITISNPSGYTPDWYRLGVSN